MGGLHRPLRWRVRAHPGSRQSSRSGGGEGFPCGRSAATGGMRPEARPEPNRFRTAASGIAGLGPRRPCGQGAAHPPPPPALRVLPQFGLHSAMPRQPGENTHHWERCARRQRSADIRTPNRRAIFTAAKHTGAAPIFAGCCRLPAACDRLHVAATRRSGRRCRRWPPPRPRTDGTSASWRKATGSGSRGTSGPAPAPRRKRLWCRSAACESNQAACAGARAALRNARRRRAG